MFCPSTCTFHHGKAGNMAVFSEGVDPRGIHRESVLVVDTLHHSPVSGRTRTRDRKLCIIPFPD